MRQSKQTKAALVGPEVQTPRAVRRTYVRGSPTLEELRFRRDLATRDGDLSKALQCAIAIDKKRGLYGK